MKKNYAARLYLEILCAIDYEDQEPAWQAARWYHVLWLMIPVCGSIVFTEAIKSAWQNECTS